MYIIQPGRQCPGWVLFALVDGGAIQGHGAAWKGVTDEPGRVSTRDQEQTIFFRNGAITNSVIRLERQRGTAHFYTLLPEHIRVSCGAAAWDR